MIKKFLFVLLLLVLAQTSWASSVYYGGGIGRNAADDRYVLETGDTMTGTLTFGNGSIEGTSTGTTLDIIPTTGDYVRVGDAGVTSHTLNTNDDLLVSGKLEVNGVLYVDNFLSCFDSKPIVLGTGSDADLRYNANQTPHAISFGVGTDSRGMLIIEKGDNSFDFAHAQQTNPTLFIHSASTAETTQYLSLTHDQTDSVIASGKGDVKIDDDLAVTGDYKMSFPMDLGEDSGFVTLFDKEITATPAVGTEESVYFAIDHEDFIALYAEADSSGGIQNEYVGIEKRLETNQGADIASAANVTLGTDGNVFEITGTTTIELISNVGWRNGSEIILIFNESVTVDDGTATSGTNITLALAGDFSATADDVLVLRLSSTTASGQAWREVSRSAN